MLISGTKEISINLTKTMNRLLVCIAIGTLIFLSSCTTKTKKVAKTTEKGDIVLILNDIPENYKFYHGKDGAYAMTGGRYEISYNVKDIVPTCFTPDYSKDKDTIVIKSVSGPLEIEHKYRGIEILSFIAHPNDTLYFSYNNKMPIVRSSRKAKKHDYDYEALIRKEVYGGDISAYTKYYLIFDFADEAKEFKSLKGIERTKAVCKAMHSRDSKYHAEKYKQTNEQFAKEEKLLDSLIANDYISKDISAFYKERIKYKRLNFEISNEKRLKSNRLNTEVENKPIVSFKNFQQNDSLLRYSFYRGIIGTLNYKNIVSKVKEKRYPQCRIADPEALYDSIQKAPSLSYETRKFLSYSSIKTILEMSSNIQVGKYFDRFKSAYRKDTSLINKLIKEYKLGQKVTEGIKLTNESGEKTSFKELLKKNKGKVIYVDFWASWCPPCRREMPASHKLKEEYKDKDVVFVYLAYNDKIKSWKKTSAKLGLKEEKNSYLIENPKTSISLECMNIKTIPRFMIYDKKGELVNKNAPRPGTKKIRKILNEYLKVK